MHFLVNASYPQLIFLENINEMKMWIDFDSETH